MARRVCVCVCISWLIVLSPLYLDNQCRLGLSRSITPWNGINRVVARDVFRGFVGQTMTTSSFELRVVSVYVSAVQ